MPPVRVGPKHQVTIPQAVREALQLSAGDFLDAAAEGGRIVLTPLHLSARAPAPRLTTPEQRMLPRVRTKIERIRKDLVRAKGLTREEAAVAAKAGIIEPDQRYWWTEEWQKGERAAEADRRAGRVVGTFASVEAMKGALKRRVRTSA
jgi:AbrB family looped-hinge helix DNA binding protein